VPVDPGSKPIENELRMMIATKEQFVLDEHGNRTGIVLSLERYRELLAAQEELEAALALDAAKASDDEAIPFDQANQEIEANRR
jgi:hypothetical protein